MRADVEFEVFLSSESLQAVGADPALSASLATLQGLRFVTWNGQTAGY